MHQPSLRFRAKLLLFTVLLAMLAFAFVSSVNSDFATDDSYRVRVAEIEEMSSDAEPSLEDWTPDALLPSLDIALLLASFSHAFHLLPPATIRGISHYLPSPRAPPML